MRRCSREQAEIERAVRNGEVKAKLGRAFKTMRGANLIARQGYGCCMGCANAALGDEMAGRPEILGAVYYHRQDAEAFDRPVGPNVGLYVRFGARDGSPPEHDAVIAGVAVEAFRVHGLQPEWDGDPRKAIWIPFPDEIDPFGDVQIGGKEKDLPK